jgi:membrane fusion protein, copper/silver efflux system
MKTPVRFIGMICLAMGIFFAGYLANRQKDPATSSASGEQAENYACPMHPQYKSDHAGDCPMCGMRLEAINAGNVGGKLAAMRPAASGMIPISAAKQQLIGVRTDEVRRGSSSHILRVPGRITVDDQRLYRIIAAADGWIRELGQNTVGRFVRQNQVLASYYTRDLLATERLFLLSLGTNDQSQKSDISFASIRTASSSNPQFPVDSLHGLGMSDLQIEEIYRARTSAPDVKIYSPVSGFILSRNISPGQRFDKGTELYRIADINHVWVMTDIFEKDRDFARPGATATIRYQDREFQARMSESLPQFDPQSRTLKTRFEIDNPGNILLPDMFVDVELHLDTPSAIMVPADAVIDSGRRKMVYVERANAEFEPRQVATGWRMGDRVQITNGLEPGERIAISGNFLIDSESRMRSPGGSSAPAAEKVKPVKDLVCGMTVDPKSPGTLKTQYKGETYYFCSETCKKSFEANPDKYIPKQTTAAKVENTKDLVCGMTVDPNSPSTLKTQYKGKTYYFCSDMCKKSFEANPEKYVHKMADEDKHGTHKTE